MADFDERSGLVWCKTKWGCWAQNIEEVIIRVDLPETTRSKEVVCAITTKSISCVVKGSLVFEGELFARVLTDDSIWTIEDQKVLNIVLVKSLRDASKCWKSLLTTEYHVDPYTFSEMEKKLTLERFQKENPGFDFSGAEISGNYSGGGPTLPTRN